jgi:DNA-binding winged helix-turn-helix (wHTH) protein/TolB-like protein/Flp pilus assembly protein TadD
MTPGPRDALRFGAVTIDRQLRAAIHAAEALPLTPKAFDLLVYLVDHRDRVVSKNELLDAVWADTAVEEANLTQTIFMLRKALRTVDARHEWIVNVPKRGYRFVEPAPADPDVAAESVEAPSPVPSHSQKHPARVWRAAGALVVIAGALLMAAVGGLPIGRSSAPEINSVAVLPLENHAGEASQLFADGIGDDLARHFARVRSVRVLTRQSSARAGDLRHDVRKLADRLGVDAVLAGELQETPSSFRLDLHLIHAKSGKETWTGHFEGARQTQESRAVATMLAKDLFAHVWPDEPPPGGALGRPEAYLALLRGRYNLANRTPDSIRAAESHFAEAIRLDPTVVEAHAGLADTWLLKAIFRVSDRREGLIRAKTIAQQALDLDVTSAEAHTSLAFALELLDHEWVKAESHFKRAIELNPSYVRAHHWYSLLLDSTRRTDEAIREMETALALDPLSSVIGSDLGMVLCHQRFFDRAIAQFTKVLTADPGYVDAHKELAQAYMYSGRLQLALGSLERAAQLGANATELNIARVIALARNGRLQEARALTGELHLPLDSPVRGALLLALGEHDQALDLLVRVGTEGDVNLLIGPIYDPVRSDPRFSELLRRAGFAELGMQ